MISLNEGQRCGTSATPCPVCGGWLNTLSCYVLDKGVNGPAAVLCRGVMKGAPLPPNWRKSAKDDGWKGYRCWEIKEDDVRSNVTDSRITSLIKTVSELHKSKQAAAAMALPEATRAQTDEKDAETKHADLLKMQIQRDLNAKSLVMANPLRRGDRFWRELESRGVDPSVLADQGLGTLLPGLHMNAEGLAGLDEGAYAGNVVGLIPSTITTSAGETLITGFQTWTPQENRGERGAKYKYLSKGKDQESSDYLKVVVDGEDPNSVDDMPLFQHDPEPKEIDKPRNLLLTDSSLKAFLASLRHRTPAAGQPGMGYAKAGKQLRSLLTQVAKPGGTALFCADAGDLENEGMLSTLLSNARMVQSWGFRVRWALWGNQVSKDGGADIDELKRNAFTEVTTEEFLGRCGIRMQELASSSVYKDGRARGFQIREENEVVSAPFDMSEPERFDAGHLGRVFKQKLEEGFDIVLNSSFTGAGKSRFTSQMNPEDYGVRFIRWVTTRHYDAAIETDVPYVRGKNKGLVKTEENRIRVLQPDEQPGEGETLYKKLNCVRMTELRKFQSLQAGNHVGSLCTECFAFENCCSTPGMYRYERDQALQSPVSAIHPSALMDMFIPGSNQGGCGLVIDELLLDTFTETINITVDDTRRLAQQLQAAGRYTSIMALANTLTSALTEQGRHGNSHLTRFIAAVQRRLVNFKPSDWAAAIELEEEMALDGRVRRCLISWFQSLINGRAVIRSDRNRLSLLRLNDRLLSACKAAKWILVMDATASPGEVSALFNIPISKVAHIAEHLPFDTANVRAIQITESGLGPLASNRTPDQQFRLGEMIRLLIDAGYFPDDLLKSSAVGNKKFEAYTEEFFGKHHIFHRDHRGSNMSRRCDLLALTATPIVNIGHLASRFELLFGHAPEGQDRVTATVSHLVQQLNGEEDLVCRVTSGPDGRFTSYVHHDISSSQLQARGRLREYRRKGADLTVINFAEYPVPWPVEILPAKDIPGWDQIERINDLGMKQLAQTMQRQGKPVNAQSLAAEVDADVEVIHRFLRSRTLRPDRFWDSILHHSEDKNGATVGSRQSDRLESELLKALAA